MKKIITGILIAIVICCIGAAVLASGVFKNCSNNEDTSEPPKVEAPLTGIATAEFTYGMEEESYGYNLVVSGYVYSDVLPENMRVKTFGKMTKLTIKTIDFLDGKYKIGFTEIITNGPSHILNGEKDVAQIYVTFSKIEGERRVVPTKTFIADDEYKFAAYVGWNSGISGQAYMKESEWIGPL